MLSGSIDDPSKHHLFVVLNDPFGDDELVLLASFSTLRTNIYCDETCVIDGNGREHDFVNAQSFVRYQRLRIEPASKLTAGVSNGQIEPKRPVSKELYARICEGVQASPFAAPRFKDFFLRALAGGC